MNATAPSAPSEELARTYLTFVVGEQEYGVGILGVREIVGMLPLTPVPGAPTVLIGVCNLRGKVIPVVGMRARFGLAAADAHPHNVIVVVEAAGGLIGLAVDRVQEVCSFAPAEIEPPPAYGIDLDTTFVKGIGKSADRIRVLLDIGKVLTAGERAHVAASSAAAGAAGAA